MKFLLAVCLVSLAPVAGAEESGDGSIPEPTAISLLVADGPGDVIIAGSHTSIGSDELRLSLAVVSVTGADGQEVRGVQLSLRSAGQQDAVYLSHDQLVQIHDEFTHLKRWYETKETCGAEKRCIHGVARCRPSQTVRQAFCPGFYSTPEGERGVVVSTPRNSFLFPSIGPAVFASASSAAIRDLNQQ